MCHLVACLNQLIYKAKIGKSCSARLRQSENAGDEPHLCASERKDSLEASLATTMHLGRSMKSSFNTLRRQRNQRSCPVQHPVSCLKKLQQTSDADTWNFSPRINWPSHHEQLANTHHSTSVREDSKAMALVRPIPLSCDINNFASDRIPLVLVPTTAPVN